MSSLAVTVFEPGEILWTAVLAAAAVGVVFTCVPVTRTPARIATAVGGTLVGWLAWNFTLHVTHAPTLDTDAPVIALSWADAGSGVLVFVVVVLLLALVVDRGQPAPRVVGMAALAGVTACVVDLFVL